MTTDLLPEFRKARLTLMHRFPFFGNLSLTIIPEEDNSVETVETDGVRIFYSREFFLSLDKKFRLFILLHEMLHIVLLHPVRIPAGADYFIWNVACDYAVNALIAELPGIQLPDDCLYDTKYAGKTAEEIYKEIYEEHKEEIEREEPEHEVSNSGSGSESQDESDSNSESQSNSNSESQSNSEPQASELQSMIKTSIKHGLVRKASPEDAQKQEQDTCINMNVVKRLMDKSTQYSDKQKNAIPGQVEQDIKDLTAIGLPWHRILADFISKNAMGDWDFSEPDPVFNNSAVIMPSLLSETVCEFVIAIDVSGSVDMNLLNVFITEAKAILGDVDYDKVHILYCHHQIERVNTFLKEDEITIYTTKTGGTSYEPVWKEIHDKGWNISGLVYFTDLQCTEVGEEPPYPVLWCVFDHKWIDAWGGLEEVYFAPKFGRIIMM